MWITWLCSTLLLWSAWSLWMNCEDPIWELVGQPPYISYCKCLGSSIRVCLKMNSRQSPAWGTNQCRRGDFSIVIFNLLALHLPPPGISLIFQHIPDHIVQMHKPIYYTCYTSLCMPSFFFNSTITSISNPAFIMSTYSLILARILHLH